MMLIILDKHTKDAMHCWLNIQDKGFCLTGTQVLLHRQCEYVTKQWDHVEKQGCYFFLHEAKVLCNSHLPIFI